MPRWRWPTRRAAIFLRLLRRKTVWQRIMVELNHWPRMCVKFLLFRTFGGKFARAQLDEVLNDECRQIAIHDLRLIVKHLVGVWKQDSGRALLHNLETGRSGCGRRVCVGGIVESWFGAGKYLSVAAAGCLREIESPNTVHFF